MWNQPAGPVEPPITTVEALLEPRWPENIELPLDLNPNRFPYARDWPRCFDGSMFEPLREIQLANVQTVDPDGLIAFFGSMGWVGDLPDEERIALLNEIKARLSAHEYRLPFETHVHSTRLAAGRA